MFNDNTKGTDTIGAFDRHADGTLTPEAGSPFAAGGAGTGTGLADRGAIQITRDGRFLIAADAGCCRLFTSAKCGPGAAQHRWSRRRADAGADLHRGGSPGVAGYQDVSRHRATTISTCDAHRPAPNLAWMSYLSRPCGMAGVTSAGPFRVLPGNGGKHVSASAVMPGMAAPDDLAACVAHGTNWCPCRQNFVSQVEKACSHIPQKSFAPTKRTRT
jgi:hypothetical protein